MMNGPMPSPIGHALAGVAIAWMTEEPNSTAQAKKPAIGAMTIVCATLAVFPDIDLLYRPIHRTATHSLLAAVLTTIVAAGVTRWVTGRVGWRMAIACGLAYASHIVLDWMGADASVPYGIQALWPFNDRWFVTPWAIFPGTERRDIFAAWSILANLRALAAELLILGPWVAVLWFRRTRRSRGPTSVPDDQPQPSA